MVKVREVPLSQIYVKINYFFNTPNSYSNVVINNKTAEPNKHTKIRCWWDKCVFNTYPVPNPKIIERRNGKTIYYCEGVFCSLPCCAAWKKEKQEDMMILNCFVYDVLGHSIDIPLAPMWTKLDIFGGNLTITQFRNFGNVYNL